MLTLEYSRGALYHSTSQLVNNRLCKKQEITIFHLESKSSLFVMLLCFSEFVLKDSLMLLVIKNPILQYLLHKRLSSAIVVSMKILKMLHYPDFIRTNMFWEIDVIKHIFIYLNLFIVYVVTQKYTSGN